MRLQVIYKSTLIICLGFLLINCKSEKATNNGSDILIKESHWTDKFSLDARPSYPNSNHLSRFSTTKDSLIKKTVEIKVSGDYRKFVGADGMNLFKYPELKILIFENRPGNKIYFPEDFDYSKLETVEEVLLDGKFPKHILQNISKLPNLKRIKVQGPNGILPSSMFETKKLETFEIYRGSAIPSGISKVTSLKRLNYSTAYNGNVDEIWQLKNLEILELRRATFDSIPDDIINLKKLKSLTITESDIIKYVSKNIGELENLEKLEMTNLYAVQGIEGDFLSKIRKLNEIVIFNVYCNPSKSLFLNTKLEDVFIGGRCKLDSIPDEVSELKKIKRLKIGAGGIKYISNKICSIASIDNVRISIAADPDLQPECLKKHWKKF